ARPIQKWNSSSSSPSSSSRLVQSVATRIVKGTGRSFVSGGSDLPTADTSRRHHVDSDPVPLHQSSAITSRRSPCEDLSVSTWYNFSCNTLNILAHLSQQPAG